MRRTTPVAFILVVALCAASVQAATPTLTVYFATGFDDAEWQKSAYEKVASAWKPAGAPKPGSKCVLIAVIAKDGKLTGLRDNMASGDPAWDKAAVEAMKAAHPFSALPKSWPHPTLEVHWHFENKK